MERMTQHTDLVSDTEKKKILIKIAAQFYT